ncbi:methyltransferase-like protein 17, mitochondrial [Bolinopsis microptera]|uniref:methyltransferase-like protein 17, mitochondrial n=1 Tax=Bolinopsis microptera TaxID=2820187 RepID=UPI00307AFE2B
MSGIPIVRRFSSLPSPRLAAMSVRDTVNEKTAFPDKLERSLKSHYQDLSKTKQQSLTQALSKKTSTTIYATPPIPPAHKTSKRKLEERAEMSYNQHLNSKEINLKQVDFIMYRSFPSLFFICNRMFSELSTFDKDFSPLTMLDLGNNLGATVWAVQKFYGKSIDDYVIHEHSKEEYNRTMKLLNVKYKPHIDNVTIMGAFSMSRVQNNPFDIVTAVNYFPYFQQKETKKWFDKVWKSTGKYLIIADISNRYTAGRMSEIRSYFNRKYKNEGHILAPCPHADVCPMRKKNDSQVCRFAMSNITTVTPKKLLPEDKVLLNHQNVEYTYLILKRGPKKATSQFARLLTPITHHDKKHSRKKKVLEFQTCNSDGSLWRAKTSFEESPHLYKHVQYRKAGDIIDQNWWDHPFTPSSVFWTSRDIEEQVKMRTTRNKAKFSNQADIDGTVEEQEMLLGERSEEESQEFHNFPTHSSLSDEEIMITEDHLESMSLLSEKDDLP